MFFPFRFLNDDLYFCGIQHLIIIDSFNLLQTFELNQPHYSQLCQECWCNLRFKSVWKTSDRGARDYEEGLVCCRGGENWEGFQECKLFTPTKVKPEVADESVDDSFDLPIPPDFPLPDAAFAFPKCRVSSSTLELLQLVKSVSTQYYTIITRKDMISCQNCISFLGMD